VTLRALRVSVLAMPLLLIGASAQAAPDAQQAAPASASATPQSAPASDETLRAREAFERGTRLVQDAKWSLARAAFDEAQALRPHAVTTYNIGACERAMGQYAAARRTFEDAMRRHETAHELTPDLVEQTRAFLLELEGLLARVTFTIAAEGHRNPVRMAIDGRPLEPRGTRVWVAGIRSAGAADAVDLSGTLELDPGHHVIAVSSVDYADDVVALDLRPGQKSAYSFTLAPVPAVLRITSSLPARVLIDGKSEGTTPRDVERPTGVYRIRLERDGYEPYVAKVSAVAGKPVELRGTLVAERVPLTKRWWFWTALAGAAAGIGVTTYLLTRPEPTRPPISGGGLGWTVPVSGLP
jgi:hypothetical protein